MREKDIQETKSVIIILLMMLLMAIGIPYLFNKIYPPHSAYPPYVSREKKAQRDRGISSKKPRIIWEVDRELAKE